MSRRSGKRPPALRALVAVVSFQGLSGLAGGVGLIVDPSGRNLGIPLAWLQGSPFPDYLVPGIVLLSVLGVAPLVVVYGLWTRRRWAWGGAVLVGLALLVWLAVEVAVIGYQSEPPLQAIYGAVAAAILGLSAPRSVREHLRLLTVAVVFTLVCAPTDPVSGQDVGPVEHPVTFHSGDFRLSGSLTVPRGAGPFPAVVLLSGSGPQDRDGATEGFVPGYRPSLQLARHLAERGVASLRYDEQGVGESTGSHPSASTAALAEDAEAAFAFLQRRPETDPGWVGLLGHSEGANMVAMIAARNPDVAFAVSLAGQAVRGYEVVLAQSEHGLRESGLSGEELDAAMQGVRAEYDLVLNERWDELEAKMRRILPAQLEAMPPDQRARLGPPDDIIADEMVRMRSWVHFFLTYDPTTDWARVSAPVLAVFGGLDAQVTPEQNRAPLEDALRRAPTDDWTVRTFPDANHLFQKAETGSPTEYGSLPPKIAPDVLEAVSGWIVERTEP